MTKSARIIRMTNWTNTSKLGQYEKTGPIREKQGHYRKNKANMKMTSFHVHFQKNMAAMISSVSPLKNCSCIYNISLNCSCIYRSRNNGQQLSLIKIRRQAWFNGNTRFVGILLRLAKSQRRFNRLLTLFYLMKRYLFIYSFIYLFNYLFIYFSY